MPKKPLVEKKVKKILGQSLKGLVVYAGVIDLMCKTVSVLAENGEWIDGWLSLRSILQYDKDRITSDTYQKVCDLEKALAPKNIMEEIKAKLLFGIYSSYDFDDDPNHPDESISKYRKDQKNAENLGAQAALTGSLVFDLLPDLMTCDNNSNLWNFGCGVGTNSEDVNSLLGQAKNIISKSKPGDICTIFLRGIISGWHKADPDQVNAFLDAALHDDTWAIYFPELQLRIPLDD